ncbi:MAG: hypothetical protein ACE5HO_10750 [bacterium]
MIRKSSIIGISLFSLLLRINPGIAQNLSVAPNVGIPKAFGDGSAFSTVGFTVGTNLFYSLSNNISVGGRIAFNRLFPDGERLLGLFQPSSDFSVESTSGGYSIFEIVPSIQIATSRRDVSRNANIAFQVGAGLYLYKVDTSAEGRISPRETFGTGVRSRWKTKPGVQLGLALGIKRRLQIQPLFNFIFNESANEGFFKGTITKYFSLNVGFLLGH